MKILESYMVEENIFFIPSTQTDEGKLIIHQPIFAIHKNNASDEIKSILKKALGNCNKISTTIEEREKTIKELLNKSEKKEWKEFQKCAKMMMIENRLKEILLIPMRKKGRGYADITGKDVLTNTDDNSIGKKLLEAFEKCK